MNKPLKILFKYPSRGRPERFFKSLDTIYSNMRDVDNFHVSCTLDTDDESMNNDAVIGKINEYKNISIGWGLSESKVHAINRSMPDIEWDILCVMSDDMHITFYGFDQIIRQSFMENGLNKLLHIPDNDAKDALATMYIAGVDFYNLFGWIYWPVFKSLFCDNHIQDISQQMGLYVFLNCPGLIFHALPAYGHQPKDKMWLEQQEIGWTEDQKTYLEWKATFENIPLSEAFNKWVNAYKDKP